MVAGKGEKLPFAAGSRRDMKNMCFQSLPPPHSCPKMIVPGCVNSYLRSEGEFTQPSLHLLSEHCSPGREEHALKIRWVKAPLNGRRNVQNNSEDSAGNF